MSAYKSSNYTSNQSYQGGGQRLSGDRTQPRGESEYTPKAMPLPSDYVIKAEEIMRECHRYITSSKLRNILSMVSDIYNSERIGEDELSEASQNALRMLQIRIVYEYGRNDDKFKSFIRETHILDHLLSVGSSRRKFIDYAHYLEAIVAYHKFYGDK